MTRRRLLVWGALVLATTACATPYGRRVPGIASGYEDEQLGARTYHVRVGKGWASDRPNMRKFALYRAAEITLDNGYRYFAIMSSDEFAESITLYAPGISTTTVSGSVGVTPFSATATTIGPPRPVGGVDAHWVHLDFRLLSAAEVATSRNVIEAQKVIDDLKLFIERRVSPFGR